MAKTNEKTIVTSVALGKRDRMFQPAFKAEARLVGAREGARIISVEVGK